MELIEDQHTEFKLIWKEDFLKQVCAFANSDGGTIYLGISDTGEVIGIDNAIQLLEKLPNIINRETGMIPDITIEKYDGKEIIKIYIQPSSVPVSYNGRYYMRSGSVVLEIEGRELSDFLLTKSRITWDTLASYPKWEFEPDNYSFDLFKRLSSDRLPFAKDEKDIFILAKKIKFAYSRISSNQCSHFVV